MSYKAKFFHPLKVSREAQEDSAGHGDMLSDLMSNPEYLRHSSSIINEALKDGFDVLQLPNGDIVTTGTKIITNTYRWDVATGKLLKSRSTSNEGAREKTTRRKAKAPAAIRDTEEAE